MRHSPHGIHVKSIVREQRLNTGVQCREIPHKRRLKLPPKDIRHSLTIWPRRGSSLLQRDENVTVGCKAGVDPGNRHIRRRFPVSIGPPPPGEARCVRVTALPVAELSVLQGIERLDDVDGGVTELVGASYTHSGAAVDRVNDLVAWTERQVLVILGNGEEFQVLAHGVEVQEVLETPSWRIPEAVLPPGLWLGVVLWGRNWIPDV